MSKPTNKRKREDQTVSALRYDWQLFISKIIQVGSVCKADVTNPKVQAELKARSQDFVDSHDKLKKLVGKMESVVRGKEEEMRGLVQARMSTGAVGKRRRRKSQQAKADEEKKTGQNDVAPQVEVEAPNDDVIVISIELFD